jgi:hypothetical protein
MGSDSADGEMMEYGDEDEMSDEESEGELLPTQEGQKSKKPKRVKHGSTFASYDEFAHLLDPESDEDTKGKAHFKKNPIG